MTAMKMLAHGAASMLFGFGLLTAAVPAHAHAGHDDEPAPPANAAPRAEAHSDLFELVAVLGSDGRLWLYLDRFGTVEPIDGATIQVTIDGEPALATRAAEAVYVLSSPALAQPGPRNLTFTVTAGDDMDLLAATLDVPSFAGVAPPPGTTRRALASALHDPFAWAALLLTLLLGVVIGRLAAPRALPTFAESDGGQSSDGSVEVAAPPNAGGFPMPSAAEPRPRRAAAAPMIVAFAVLLPLQVNAQPMDSPRRQPDGSVFVPKPTQRLFGIRTAVVERSNAPNAVQLVGQVIADPNASGRVQAPQAGRFEPPEDGFPTLGSRVARGQALGHIVPVLAAQERGGVQASLAELDAQATIAQQRVQRLSGLAGSVSAREIAEARAELDGLRARRAALATGLNGRDAVRAPVSGVLSVVNAVAGQIVDAREVLFEVVDPGRLWVEAVAFDPGAIATVRAASAMTAGRSPLPLVFVGRGLALRQQAVPLQFRIENPPDGLAVGAPVTVTVQTLRSAEGIVVPASAVIRTSEGIEVAFEMSSAERFVPRPVRVQPLDGHRVLIVAGLDPGVRVVVEAASLIAQVR